MGNSETTINCLSICSGIRGIERGLERVISNLRTICHVEIEAFIIENLVAEMEAGMVAPAPVWSNLKTFDPAPFRGMVDILTGGYPCQPFSTAGKRRGAEDPRHLYPYIERAIRIIRPRICFFENVRGHVTCGLPEVIASLEGLGYRVHWGIYSAEETGAAHKRERVFIMAYSAGAGKWRGKGNIHQENGRPDGELPLIVNGSGGELADDRGIRIIKSLGGQPSKQLDENGSKRIVSRPGHPQHKWESPRTIITDDAARLLGGYGKKYPEAFQKGQIEQVAFDGFTGKVVPHLDLSAHGYHFREDILRALGNSVYEDTAELAFRDLARKHGLNFTNKFQEEKEHAKQSRQRFDFRQ